MALPNQNQIFSAVSDLLDLVVPLLGATIVLAKVTGEILKATNPDHSGPPPTYFIGLDPNDPTAQAAQAAADQDATAVTPVIGIGLDQAGGWFVEGPDLGVLVGSSGQPIAAVGLAKVGDQWVLTGNHTVLAGLGQLPVAGQGSASGYGPVSDATPDGVFMQVSPQMKGPPGRHTIYNVAGTGGKWDADFTATICDAVNKDRWYWHGVSYPAETFPMGPSVKAGVEELVRLIASTSGTFGIMGYSQGAIVTCKVWRDEIMNPNGRLHDRMGDIFAHVSFGNPLRCPGYSNGNALVPLPPLENEFGFQTSGIAGPDNLTPWQTMPWHMDFNHNGDLFATCPTGPDPWANEAQPGEYETAIYKLVQGELTGDEGILQQVGEILTDPFNELVPVLLAVMDGIQFLAHNTHGYDDCRDAAIGWLNDVGYATPVKT